MKLDLKARIWILSLAFIALPWPASFGQNGEPPISTDRPGFLFAPTVVPEGRLQVETGLPTLTLLRDSQGDIRAWTLPVAVRYGLTEKVELRASLPTWTDLRDETGTSTLREDGFGDSEFGAKLALPELSGEPLAFQASLRLPTGEDAFTTDEVGGTALLLHGRTLPESFWLQTMLGATHTPIDGSPDQTTGAAAALLSHPIAGRWSAFVEGTALPGFKNAAGQSYVGAAVVFAARDNVQLDLSADFGLDNDSADVIAALGLSWHF
jgi:hypothetical protein